MKFTIDQKDLDNLLSTASRAVSTRPSHPILANVLLVAKDDRLSVSAFDLSLSIQTSVQAFVDEAGTTTLPAKLFSDIVSRLPAGEVTIVLKENEAQIKCSSGKYKIRGMDVTEFPELPSIDDAKPISLPTATIQEALRNTLYAVSLDETKQILTGVHWTIDTETIELAGCDGHRLSVFAGEITHPGEKLEATIPAKALREVERLLAVKGAFAEATLSLDHTQAIFELGDSTITTRLLEGQYPNYGQLIPRQFALNLTVDRRSLLSSLERIAVLADQKNNVVKVTIDSKEQKLLLVVDAQDVGSGNESVSAQITGDGIDLAFNVRYLMDTLKTMNTSEVQMSCNTPTSPVILSPVGGDKVTGLLMPIQVRS